MKKNLVFAALVSALVLGGSIGSATVNAAVDGVPSTAKTQGIINFSLPTDAVDPLDPTTPLNPDGTQNKNPNDDMNKPTGNTGALTLDTAPYLSFGQHVIGEQAGSTYTLDSTANPHPYLQVSDRRGVNADKKAQGWTVTVAVTDFSNGSQSLAGTKLSFATGTVKAGSESASTQSAPTSLAVNGLSSASSATAIFGASVGQGIGTWLDVYAPANVSLSVPTPAVGDFTADLTWSLNSTLQA